MIENARSLFVNVSDNKVEGSAFTDAVYILNAFIGEKTFEEISKEFGYNILPVQTWLNYLSRIQCLRKTDVKWRATGE